MRTVPVVAAAVWLVGGMLEASPFAGLDHAPGVYVTVDGYGITIEQSAVDWDFSLNGRQITKWKKGSGSGRPPHVEISCRAEGGYSPREALRAVWSIPRPAGWPKGLSADQQGVLELCVALDVPRRLGSGAVRSHQEGRCSSFRYPR